MRWTGIFNSVNLGALLTATSCSLDPIQTNGNVRRSETLTQFSQSVKSLTAQLSTVVGTKVLLPPETGRPVHTWMAEKKLTRISLMREPAAFCNFLSAPNQPTYTPKKPWMHFGLVPSRLLLGLRLCLLQCGTRMAGQGLRLRLLFPARRVQCMSVPGILSCPEIPIIPGLYGICPKLCSLPVFCPQLSSVSLFSLEFLLPWKRKLHEHEIK